MLVQGAYIENTMFVLNAWNDNIHITHDHKEHPKQTSFLDILFTISVSGNVLHGFFRKPNNAYSYTPYTSNHSKSCLHGIVSTECVRLQRVCGSTEEFKKECTFFAKKLREKPYPVQTVREHIDNIVGIIVTKR